MCSVSAFRDCVTPMVEVERRIGTCSGFFYLHHTIKSHLSSYLLFMIVTGEFEVIANSCTILQKCGAHETSSFF